MLASEKYTWHNYQISKLLDSMLHAQINREKMRIKLEVLDNNPVPTHYGLYQIAVPHHDQLSQ